MAQRIVIALGGNAILTKDPSAQAQMDALVSTAKLIVPLIKAGNEVIITHGNGPQVGNLLLQQEAANSEKNPALPLDTCGAMTQGSIGYWTLLALKNELAAAGVDKNIAVLVTTAAVDPDDPAFLSPTKPVGPFLTEEQAREASAKDGCVYREDAGRGWRKMVPSPKPIDIPGRAGIISLVEGGSVVVCTGGGGIPVINTADGVKGVEAVIDKDFTAEKLAEVVGADMLVICTGVDNVCVNWNKPDEKALSRVGIAELEDYIEQGQFPAGSMLPKIRACMQFVQDNPGKRAVITSLEKLAQIEDGAGTEVVL